MLELRRLRLLHALEIEGTVTAVAETARISGSAVSQQLAQLERETGVQLVERVGRRLRLTEAGRVLVAHTRIVLDQLAAAEADLIGLGADVTGTVRLSGFSSAIAVLVAETWRELRADYANRIQLRIATVEPEDGLLALKNGETDLVIAYSYELAPSLLPVSVEQHALLTDPVVLVMGRDNPLHTSTAPDVPIDLARLADYEWVVPDAASRCRQMVEQACRAAGFVPRVIAHCTDFSAMFPLVSATDTLALVPRLAACPLSPDVAMRAIVPGTSRQIFAVTRPGGTRHPAVRVVLDQLAKTAGRHATGGA